MSPTSQRLLARTLRSVGADAPVERLQTVVRASGESGIQPCHAGTSSGPASHGHDAKTYDAFETGVTRSLKLVTIPKLRPPPPRQAQKRSAL